MSAPVERFFDNLFKNRRRRTTVLAHFLCTVPKIMLGNRKISVIDTFEYLISCFAVQPTECKITNSELRITEGFVVPLKCLSKQECYTLRENTAQLAKWELKTIHRALLMRDFVNICFLMQNRVTQRKQWPLFALMAVQRLIFVHDYRLSFLFDAERSLQGYGEMPVLR